MVRRAKQNVAEASDLSSHLSDTSSLSSDPPGSGGSDKDSDDEDDDNRRRGVKPKSMSKKVLKKQTSGGKRKTLAKSKQPAAAAMKSKLNRSKSIPGKKLKDSRGNLYKNAGTDQQYCICRGGYNGKEFMVACDSCQEWFHGRCIGISEKDVPDHYYCNQCDDASDEEATSQKEQRQGKKGRKSAKSKPTKVKASVSPKAQRKKAELKQELPTFKVEDIPVKPAIAEPDADVDGSDEDLDDICPVCDSECTCGTKAKSENESFATLSVVAEEPVKSENNFVHDSGVIEIIGEEPTQPKRPKAKSKASEKKGKDSKPVLEKHPPSSKRPKSKKSQVAQKVQVIHEDVDDDIDDDVASVTEMISYQSDISEAAYSSGSYLEGPAFSHSEGSVHIESGDDEDIEEEEERALIEQWELLQDQDELSDTSSEEDFDLDDEETMALMLEDQYETDEEMYTNEFLRQANNWSSDEEEEEYDEEIDDFGSDDAADINDLDDEFDDDEDYDSEEGDAADMQFSPFFDENTDVSELLDNIAAALALSISLPAETGEDTTDLSQQLQRALVEAGIDLSTIDERHPESVISEVDEPGYKINIAANDSDVDITGTADDISPTSPVSQSDNLSAGANLMEGSESASALSQSLVSDLLLASGQGATSDGKIDSDMIAAAVQDIVNAVTAAAKQENIPSGSASDSLLEITSSSSIPPTSPSESSPGQSTPSTSSTLKRDPEEEVYSDRQQRRRLSVLKEEAVASQKAEEAEQAAVLMDDLVDTSRLYTRCTSRSPSPEPAESNRFSQDLSRWQRVPIGTFRRSRRVSAPMIHASTALRSGNDEFASTLLCDLDVNPAADQAQGDIAENATVPKKRRRPKYRGRSAAKSMSDLASIIQRSKDLLPANVNTLQGDPSGATLGSQGMASNAALPSTLSLAIASAVAALRQSGGAQSVARGGRRPLRQGSLSSGLDTDQPPSSACSSPLYSPLFSGIRHNDLSIPDLHLDEVVAELQKQEENEKSAAAQRKGRRPNKLSSA